MFGVDREWQQTQNLFSPDRFPREKYHYDVNDDWNFHSDDEKLMLEFEREHIESMERDCILPDEEVADFHLAVGEDSVEEYFSPRCVLKLTLQRQRDAISAGLLVDEDWAGLALMLSPIPPAKKVCQVTPQTLQKERNACLLCPDIPETDDHWAELAALLSPLPAAKKVCQVREPSPPCNVCLCPACAGADAKPMVSTCVVCDAQILYSICTKHHPVAEPQQPSVCCVCMRVLTL